MTNYQKEIAETSRGEEIAAREYERIREEGIEKTDPQTIANIVNNYEGEDVIF